MKIYVLAVLTTVCAAFFAAGCRPTPEKPEIVTLKVTILGKAGSVHVIDGRSRVALKTCSTTCEVRMPRGAEVELLADQAPQTLGLDWVQGCGDTHVGFRHCPVSLATSKEAVVRFY